MLRTPRITLQPWHDRHRDPFAYMHADLEVMADLGGPIDRSTSDAKFDRYLAAYVEHGVSRWAIEDLAGRFLGYSGVMPRLAEAHPLGPHFEVGWRFVRAAWGCGYATESAAAALKHAFEHLRVAEILSYTSAENRRSQAVMGRLGLRREPARDFEASYEAVGTWRGLVWVAARGFRNPTQSIERTGE